MVKIVSCNWCRILLLFFCMASFAIGGRAVDMSATPLQMAVGQMDQASGYKPRVPDLQKVKTLLEDGANVNEINMWGSALHAATRFAPREIVEYLIAHGADINLRGNAGETPLMTAAQSGKLDIVELLVQKGADVNAVAAMVGWSPLSEAAYSGHYDIVNYLIGKGADVKVQASAAYIRAAAGMGLQMKENTPQAQSVGIHNPEKITFEYIAILDLLVSKGANINAVDQNGQNALHQAATFANPQVLRYFLKAGVSPNTESKYMGTPLVTAQKMQENYMTMLTSRPAGLSDEMWEKMQKYVTATALPGLKDVIAILTPLTTAQVAANGATANQVPPAPAQVARNETDATFAGQMMDTMADCAKLKLALNACERMPWPLSSGCNSLAKAQYSNAICKG